MSLFVNAPQEEAFRSLMDYFTSRRMRILTSNSPSYIRTEFGSWVSMSFGSAKGEVEVNITKRDSGSYVNLTFSFLKEYLSDLIGAIIGALIIYVVVWAILSGYLSGYPSEIVEKVQSLINMLILGGMVLMFGVIMGLSGYNTSRTRKRFIEEFNMFIQSLASKKD